jgi:putative holliday junction resolvase
MARVLALDFGERRIGVAISDPSRTIGQPLDTIARRARKRAPIAAILELAERYEVDHFVVGLPLTLAGDDSDWTREVRAFAARLSERSGRPVTLVDERMTSVLAERTVRALGLPRRERHRKERIDAAAATLILQAFLDAQHATLRDEEDDENR